MTGRPIQSLKPFPFAPDFQAPAEPDANASGKGLTLTAEELSRLAATLQAEGAASARAPFEAQALAQLETIAERLAQAAEQVGAVADALDNPEISRDATAALARRVAQSITDGQGDLLTGAGALMAGAQQPGGSGSLP
ncbi:MAG: hypothetical protein AAGJ32_08715 [Pseudomonadota bacterium]